MTDQQNPEPEDDTTEETSSGPTTSEMLAKLRRVESAAAISTPHQGMVFAMNQITPPAPPPVHRHRWAWAQLVSGGVRRVCYDCGTEA